MGLAERRAIKTFQDEKYPGFKENIDSIAGFEVEMEVRWDTLAKDGYDHMYDEAFEKVYFMPLAEAFREIAVDDMGKEALKEGLKKVVIRDTSGNREITFERGVLTIDHDPVSNIDYWGERKKTIQELLENGL